MTPFGYRPYLLKSENYNYFNLMGNFFAVFQSRQEENFGPPEIMQRWKKTAEQGGIAVYENNDALPRSFIVHDVEVEVDAQRLLNKLGSTNLRSKALVEKTLSSSLEAFSGGELAKDQTQILDYSALRMKLMTESDRAGLLLLTDQFDKTG